MLGNLVQENKINFYKVLSLLFSICYGFLDDIMDNFSGIDMSRSYCKCGEKSSWTDWSDCNKSCGTGKQTKTKVCFRKRHFRCRFDRERTYTWEQQCNTHACRKYDLPVIYFYI